MNTTTSTISREAAVDAVAGHINAPDMYVIGVMHDCIDSAIAALANLPTGWTAYLDSGIAAVLVTNEPLLVSISTALGLPFAMILAVPKDTCTRNEVSDAFGTDEFASSDKDVALVKNRDDPNPSSAPSLLIDAADLAAAADTGQETP